MLDSLYKASPNEQKLQDENEALRDQVVILENELLKYKLPSTDPKINILWNKGCAMILRKILTTNTQLILGCAKREKLEFSFENEMFLESLSMNRPVSNMIILRSIKFGLHQYVNGLDDAVFYYPLLEHTGGTQKNESRKIGIAVNSCTLGVIIVWRIQDSVLQGC